MCRAQQPSVSASTVCQAWHSGVVIEFEYDICIEFDIVYNKIIKKEKEKEYNKKGIWSSGRMLAVASECERNDWIL
jgi:hypothetical protein